MLVISKNAYDRQRHSLVCKEIVVNARQVGTSSHPEVQRRLCLCAQAVRTLNDIEEDLRLFVNYLFLGMDVLQN